MLSMEDIRNLKVADLKNELKQRKLSTAGKKADLISRLEAYFTEAKGGQEETAGQDGDAPDHTTVEKPQSHPDAAPSSEPDVQNVEKSGNRAEHANMVPARSHSANDKDLDNSKRQKGKVAPPHSVAYDFSSIEVFQEFLVQYARETWAFGQPDNLKSGEYDPKVVEHLYQSELGGGQTDPQSRPLALLEFSMYLENYLWPFYKPKSVGPSHLISAILIVNEKAREGSPTWTCFHGRKDEFPAFFAEILSLLVNNKLTHVEKIMYLNFLSHAFQSLEDTMVCAEVLRLVGLPLWHALSPGRLQLELHEHPNLVKHWKSLLKREAKLQAESKEGQWLKLCQKQMAANFIPTLLTEFLTVLETEEAVTNEKARKYCEFFVSFLSNLLSQLPTRRFLHAVLDDQAVWIRCCRSHLYGHPLGKNFVKLVDNMQSLLTFPIDDHTGDAINDDDGVSRHHERVLRLQRLMFKHWPQLKEASLVNCNQLARHEVLQKYLLNLAAEDLRRLVVKQLRLVSEAVANGKDSKFLIDVMIAAYERHKSQKEVIQSMPLYPTEKMLLDDEAIPPDGIQATLTSKILTLPTLNLQFLSLMDYLVRNFMLFQLESAFEIREDIADAIRRANPYVGDDGVISYSGWSRMALQIRNCSIVEVKQPRIGEKCPASVIADVVVDIQTLRADIAAEWDQLKEHDVLFFLRFDAQILANKAAIDWKGPKGRALFLSGLQYVRGAEIIEIRDADGKLMNDFSGRTPIDEVGQPAGTLRTITISLDPVQYHQDVLDRGREDVRKMYSNFDLVVRRHARENNFKSVLESVRDLVTDEESVEAIPSWLHDVLLGYGDPKDSSVEIVDRPHSIDCKDTFMNLAHLKESFPGYDVVCTQCKDEDSQIDSVRPYFRITMTPSRSSSAENNLSKKRKNGGDGNGTEEETRKELTVERYFSPDPGPYPQDAAPLNSVRFTPVQVSAILSGVQPGLTTIVGPPGTGKTDTAVQMIHLLYHNFPGERILLITHSNQALNDLFLKITERDVPSRHLLRLGMGEAELNTEEAYSRAGRVNAMLTRRLELLSEVERLARCLNINESVAYTCETAAHFWLLHVLSRWERFTATLQQTKDAGAVEEHFPFKSFFSNTSKPLFEGKDFENDWNRALGCFRHLSLVFQELEEIRPFEVLKSHGDRIKYLITKQAKIIAMTCTHAAIKRKEFLELGFTFDTLLMEEAAQVLDIETVLPLMIQRPKDGQSSLKRVILIGDHHQLPPVVKNGALQKWCHMEQSLFTRLIRLGVPYLQLDAQGRSRPSIAALYNWRYDNLGNLPLVTESAVFKLANPGFAYDYQLIDVPDFLGRGESEPVAYYYQNLGEAEYVVSVYQYMRLLGYPAEKISILTTYNGQCALLQDVIERRCAHDMFGRPGAISTVDKYQGQQNDYILLSLVRTRHFGHLRDVRRLVVAMSRARLGLYVFARAGLFANCYELRPTFTQLMARPLQLALVSEEQYGNVSRNVDDEVVSPLFASGIEHMASVVQNMGVELANLATH